MFKKYSKKDYLDLDQQHNILVLVGNGFDISVLKKYKEGLLNGKTTSYSDFYDFITYYRLIDESNILLKKMKQDKEAGKNNWSDFENTIDELYTLRKINAKTLEGCIDEFQTNFTRFLNDLVDSNLLIKVSSEA